jgi:hypothetical protein
MAINPKPAFSEYSFVLGVNEPSHARVRHLPVCRHVMFPSTSKPAIGVCVCVLKTENRTPRGKLLLRLASRQECSVLENPRWDKTRK